MPSGGTEPAAPPSLVDISNDSAPSPARLRRPADHNTADDADETTSCSAAVLTPPWLRPNVPRSKYEHIGKLAALWNGALDRCVLLNRLSRAELDFVLSATRPIPTHEGERIYVEGDFPSCFYLVARGRYRATVQHKGGRSVTARECGPMDNFGACEMLAGRGARDTSILVLSSGGSEGG